MTKTIVRALLLCALFLSGGSFADVNPSTGTINYEGQGSDSLSLENKRTETRYREEERDTTCTRKVPYTERVCANETRYKQECNWVPGHNQCRTVYDQVCRNVTRYRQQCRTAPGRQVCRQVPGRRTCRTRRDGRQVCHTSPARRVCRTEPGRRTCRQVPYTDRVCRQVPRQQCTHIPGRNVCRQVAYQEYVCRDVTRYRDETYACRRTVQVPYDFVKELLAEISVDFSNSNEGSKANLDFTFNTAGEVVMAVNDRSATRALILGSQEINRNDTSDKLEVTANFDVKFLNKAVALAPVREEIADIKLGRTDLAFTVAKADPLSRLGLHVKISRDTVLGNNRVELDRVLSRSDYQVQDLGTHMRVLVDLDQFDVKLKKKDHKIAITTDLVFVEKILNASRPVLSKTSKADITVK